ncbi:DUF2029 domain-containing protein [Aliiroseovarius sp. S1123]|uniref:glycosyltransferase family 87 protein n=1 Tax=unclassified Aliiroseovarius TaxID=2623558 RepID=UPI001FF53BF7|nr:glycosyltransferase family 87 protein [Aliiroseovarius sp. S1123]MCK0171207.1 DUF2029 domain-containing protein [Aliiroseovarius sp. S1123]
MTDRMDRVLGVVVLAGFVALAVRSYWGNWPVDLSALYFAAYFFDAGAHDLVYAPDGQAFWDQAHPEWRELARAQGYEANLLPAYVYPPLWAAVLGPWAGAVSFASFANSCLIAFLGAIIGMIFMAYEMACRIASAAHTRMIPFATFCLIGAILAGYTSFGSLSFQLGQPQILVSFLLMLCLYLLGLGKDIPAGSVLALAAAIKLMPAMLVVLFVMENRWRALGAFVLAGALLAGLSVIVAGWPMHQALLERVGHLSTQISISRLGIGMETVLYHIGQAATGDVQWQIERPELIGKPVWLGIAARAILIVGMLAIWFCTRAVLPPIRLWVRFTLLFLLVVTTASLSWLHYLILPALLALISLGLSPSPRVRLVLLGGAVLTSLPVYLWLLGTPLAGYGEVYLHLALIAAVALALLLTARNHRG